MQARDRGAPFAFYYWTDPKTILTQTKTISRYSEPMQKKLAFALLNATLTPGFLTAMGKEFYIRPAIKNMALPPNLAKAGVENSADATAGFWKTDWQSYLEREDEIVEQVNSIFSQ
jgi:putative spermidine/putrescine transport system substrate-binding protein